MSVNDMEVALLNQQVEFLQLELDESKARESSLRTLNDSLMEALNHTDNSDLQTHYESIIADLQQTNEVLATNLNSLTLKFSQLDSSSQAEITRLAEAKRELKKLLNAANEKLTELTTELTESRHAQAELTETWALKETEWTHQKKQLSEEQTQLRTQLTEVEASFAQASALLQQCKQDESKEFQYICSLEHTVAELRRKLNSVPHTSETQMLYRCIHRLETELEEKERSLLRLQLELDTLTLQKDKAQVQFDRALLELKQHRADLCGVRRPVQGQAQLKQEIKHLIGSLLTAKSSTIV